MYNVRYVARTKRACLVGSCQQLPHSALPVRVHCLWKNYATLAFHTIPYGIWLYHTRPPIVACKMEGQSEYVHIAHTILHVRRRLVPLNWHIIVNKISASELSRKLVKRPLLVGQDGPRKGQFFVPSSRMYQNCLFLLCPHCSPPPLC